MTKKVAVIGGGMAGLSSAYHLQKAGVDVTLFEGTDSVGGRAGSKRVGDYIFDEGAITLSPGYQHTIRMMTELGASEKLVPVDLVMAFVRDGQLHELDLSHPLKSGLSTKLLSLRSKLTLLKLAPLMRRYGDNCHFESMADLAEVDSQTCRDYALPTLGQELHDYFVDPIIRINMFASTSVSSLVDLVWLLKMGGGGQILQVKGGMGEVARTIASSLKVKLNAEVGSVMPRDQGVQVAVGGELLDFDGAVIATPPPIAVTLAPWLQGPVRDWFDSITPVKSLTVQVGVSETPASRAAMILVPHKESDDIIGISLDHNKMPDRAPAGNGAITLHMNQSWAEKQAGQDDMVVARTALACASPFLGDYQNKIEAVNLHHWEYVDHSRYVGVYKKLEGVLPLFRQGRVQFAGEYISAGIEGAATSGLRCAEALQQQL